MNSTTVQIMFLPEVLEIVPWSGPPTVVVTVPGSKSITNRALVLAALADGETRLQSALWSDDTQVMVAALQQLGFSIQIEPDSGEAGNRHLTVQGKGGSVPPGGTIAAPMEIFVGLAGTAARFLAALLCVGSGVYRLHGGPPMHVRPQAGLFVALRQLGYRVESEKGDDHLPALIYGDGTRMGAWATVSTAASSQFASALILAAQAGGWKIDTDDDHPSPYVEMTRQQTAAFPHNGGTLVVEPDASGGSYFWAADALPINGDGDLGLKGNIQVANWPTSGWQIDAEFTRYLPLPAHAVSRQQHLGDSIMTAMILAPLGKEPVLFTELARLRVQECERVEAMRVELGKCGAEIVEEGDTLRISPSALHGATIDTYDDHRMAMCFAILGLVVPGIRLRDPSCVAKTFPLFFHKLAAPPPHGLGVELRDRDGKQWAPEQP
jgi:3-phosphoshikimate 1-carboxyvinyltransferase